MSTNPVAQTITVEIAPLASPMVLCSPGFLHTLAEVERDVAGVTITDAATQASAAALLTRLTGAGQALEKARTTLKAPLLEAGRQIDAAAKAPQGRIDAAKGKLNTKLVAFQQEQAFKAREAEAARLTELRRLEVLRQQEAEAAKKAAAEKVVTVDWDEPAPVAIPPVAKPAGVAFRVSLIIDTVDVAKLPKEFTITTADTKAIRQAFCNGWDETKPMPVLAGCTFKVDRLAVTKGAGDF